VRPLKVIVPGVKRIAWKFPQSVGEGASLSRPLPPLSTDLLPALYTQAWSPELQYPLLLTSSQEIGAADDDEPPHVGPADPPEAADPVEPPEEDDSSLGGQ
jgi:hypothetical protein